MRFLTLFLILFAGSLAAQEAWICQAGGYWQDGAPIYLTAKTPGENKGEIIWHGEPYETSYRYFGYPIDNRLWKFGETDDPKDEYRYSFVIRDGGRGYLYNLPKITSDLVGADAMFQCREEKE